MKVYTHKVLLLTCLLAAVFAGTASGQTTQRILKSAREAAASDRHREAIDYYLEAVNRDSSLAAELGREIGYQYTWGGKPDSAVIWFNRYLELHPRELEGMLGKARALSWADRKSESLNLYRRIQGKHPRSIEARIGEARVTSWQDRNAEAEELYRKILEKQPENLQALLGLAQVINWQGRHREARQMYREILELHQGNRDAILGLALAERWLGLNWKARERLEKIGGNGEARKILRSIYRERSYRVRFDNALSSDSDELVINRIGSTFFTGIARGTMAKTGAARISMSQDDSPSVDRTDFTAGISSRFNEDWSLNLNLSWMNHSVETEDPVYSGGDDFSLLACDGWLTWTPNRRVRVDLSSGRSAVETPRSVMREISYTTVGIGTDFLLAERIKSVIGYEYRSYSDHNHRNLVKTAIRWKVLKNPFSLQAEPGYTWFSYRQWLPNGYYNPEEYHNLGLKVTLGFKLSDSAGLIIEGRGSSEKEGGEDFFAVGTFRSALQYKAAESLDVGAEFFASNSKVSGEAGYSRTLGGLYLIWIF
ncbi:MAG: hypothetical protein GF417_07930 [Candidatus Latescibacteria bacterium]|nr:hypothetical protein [bacterium]MBD3424349.1 hypothetical protein [Candidatus Latescibacterota bacterium]